MNPPNRIMQIVTYSEFLRKEVLGCLLCNFELWQAVELDCYAAEDWFAIQEIESQWQGVSI